MSPPGDRRHDPLLPGFKEMAARRKALSDDLVARRISLGLTQTQVAARMGTSQSAVARVEAAASDVRLSTIERYAAAVGHVVEWSLGEGDAGVATRGRPDRTGPETGGRR
jgi:transcriptional regulator with XRE-family HTH domain